MGSLGCCPIQQISRQRSDWGVEGMKRSYIEKQFWWTELSDGENHSVTAAQNSECLLHSQTERQGYCIQEDDVTYIQVNEEADSVILYLWIEETSFANVGRNSLLRASSAHCQHSPLDTQE